MISLPLWWMSTWSIRLRWRWIGLSLQCQPHLQFAVSRTVAVPYGTVEMNIDRAVERTYT